MDRQYNTVEVSPELKSTARHILKGRQAEDQALRYFLSQGFVFWARNFKTPFSEIDLLLKKDDCLYSIEVKSLIRWEDLPTRVHRRQVQRLQRSLLYLLSEWDCDVKLLWAFVLPDGTVFILDDYPG